ncbi:hypothetical protein QBC40DRAFT_15519 [Triangularia verruculosa]|uniref:Zn(2)-C6 fungal-type domain-containing protein n=1 Tax=Triangularia verruculosa TaxID=2587418 RepID=A0AAN6XAH0_9PEZI|nr:hypothetical protein QBC40DRAFT_15519 [Triangularia verruculosa]
MSTASSPVATSPQPDVQKASRVCLNCKRKKKKCDKALPSCSRCVESYQVCQHEDDIVPGSSVTAGYLYGGVPSPLGNPVQLHQQSPLAWGGSLRPSLVTSIRSADNINTYALQCVFDILDNRQGIEQVILAFFEGPNACWFSIIDRSNFEDLLEDLWTNPLAETCVLILCMSLIASPPISSPSPAAMRDGGYQATKALLTLVQSQSSLPMAIPFLQAELLVAMYEYSQALPQQAYLSVGRCFQMSRALGWQEKSHWSPDKLATIPRILKLHSILWWAMVYIDNHLHVAYQEPRFPLYAPTLGLGFEIPRPETFDPFAPSALQLQIQGVGPYRDANSHHIDGMVFPEATSAFNLNTGLRQLENPLMSPEDHEDLSDTVWQHTLDVLQAPWSTGDRSGAIGTNLIAMLKLNQPGLLAGSVGIGPRFSSPAERIEKTIEYFHNEAVNLANFQHRLTRGRVAPFWAFAAYYSSILLISHGEAELHTVDWLQKVLGMKNLLQVCAGRWKIAERYVYLLDQHLRARLGDFVG